MILAKRFKAAWSGFTKSATTYNPTSVWLRGNGTPDISGGADIGAAFENCAVAYACIERIAKDAAGVPLKALTDPEDKESEAPATDEVARLLARPNQVMSTSRLIEWSVMLHRLRGEFFWTFDNPQAPTEIYPWHDPRYWREHCGKKGLAFWEYSGSSQFKVMPGEVLQVATNTPSNPYRGQSPLQAAKDAVGVQVFGDSLQRSILERGGERGMVLHRDGMLDDDQWDQFMGRLNSRRPGNGEAGRDFLIEDAELLNPDFTKEDFDVLAWQGASKKKICNVYGMAPVLIGDDDSAQYKSAPEAIKLYWQSTMLPLLRSLEDAFDHFFVDRRGKRTYLRFDLSKVAALQRDEMEKSRIAKIHCDLGIPLVAINEKLGLGYDDATMAEADEANAYVPPVPEPIQPPSEPEPDKSYTGGLTNKIIKARADKGHPASVQRRRRMGRLESSTWNNLKGVSGTYRNKVEAAIKTAMDESGFGERGARAAVGTVRAMQQSMGQDMRDAVSPAHVEAAQLGASSIKELIDGKSMPWHDRVKAVSFGPDATSIMARRGHYIQGNLTASLIDHVNEKIMALVTEAGELNESVGWVTSRIRGVFNGWAKGQAKTIARTEVGTMYNVSRFDEMGKAGFGKHEWVTALDESTRDDDDEYDHASCDGQVRSIGETFSCGLAFPQEDGGAAGNVINCRCETIPVVED